MSTEEFSESSVADTSAGSTPGVHSHMPGEDDTDSSVGGVMPDGDAIDHVDDGLPGVNGASNAGDSVADDADPDPDADPLADPLNGPNGTSEEND